MEGWSITIEKTGTGYILDTPEPTDELGKCWVREDNENDELQAIERVLWDILTYFGHYGSKHDSERIRIVREKSK
jgi:hypothetical protein